MMLWSWLVAVSDVNVLASIMAPSTATIWIPSLWSSFCCRSWMKFPADGDVAGAGDLDAVGTGGDELVVRRCGCRATHRSLSGEPSPTWMLRAGPSLRVTCSPVIRLCSTVTSLRPVDDLDAGVVRRVDRDVTEVDAAAARR